MDYKNLICLIVAVGVCYGQDYYDYESKEAHLCSTCSPGYEVTSKCTESLDTVCSPCDFGYYQDSYIKEGPCFRCSECKEDEFSKKPCSSKSDTLCASCKDGGGHGNEDFLSKCKNEAKQIQGDDDKGGINGAVDLTEEDLITEVPLENEDEEIEEDWESDEEPNEEISDDINDDPGADTADTDDDNDVEVEVVDDNFNETATDTDTDNVIIVPVEEGSGYPEPESEIKFAEKPDDKNEDLLLEVHDDTTEPGVAAAEGGNDVETEETTDDGSGVLVVPIDGDEIEPFQGGPVVADEVEPMIAEAKDGGSGDDSGKVPVFALIITAVVCAIVFFAVGFLIKKYAVKRGLINGQAPGDTEAPSKSNNVYIEMEPKSSNHVADESAKPLLSKEPPKEPKDASDMDIVQGDVFQEDAGGGQNQSPVNIVTTEAVFEETLPTRPLDIVYVSERAKEIINTGHSFQIKVDPTPPNCYIEGGPLSSKYQLEQFHFHWGSKNECGSEHTVDGKEYAAELHLVHWNRDIYGDFSEAVEFEAGLCVIAVFLKVDRSHSGLQKLMDKLGDIHYKGDTQNLDEGFNPMCLLPSDTTKYWTYSGSLTTPPYNETVTWIVLKEPIDIGEEQIRQFRSLLTYGKDEGFMQNNYRAPQALSGRSIFSSFKS
ncbi:unnamed protein product [Owenia fusiformis]|uniref:Carbonic anhydrase n=1 Tax=Owenia fusiformis TaxID=6347 RepID=A0A8J1URA3_OWEFU|nr:unnamed protein product [Owenia fusiformis]